MKKLRYVLILLPIILSLTSCLYYHNYTVIETNEKFSALTIIPLEEENCQLFIWHLQQFPILSRRFESVVSIDGQSGKYQIQDCEILIYDKGNLLTPYNFTKNKTHYEVEFSMPFFKPVNLIQKVKITLLYNDEVVTIQRTYHLQYHRGMSYWEVAMGI